MSLRNEGVAPTTINTLVDLNTVGNVDNSVTDTNDPALHELLPRQQDFARR